MQIITFRDFLPVLLGSYAPRIEDYQGFDPSVNPGIATELWTADYGIGHTMLSPTLLLDTPQLANLPLRNAFHTPYTIHTNPSIVHDLIVGFTKKAAQALDAKVVDDVRSFLFTDRNGLRGLDLVAFNIQRGRDHCLRRYNDVREAYGLPRLGSFAQLTSDPHLQQSLTTIYNPPSKMDAWMGCLVEDHQPGSNVGPLTVAILRDQFTRLRDGDPFFFKNHPDWRD
ncbi:hypothetical protein ACA910_009439 [Epithemia clementina (nom. ined.)]